MSKRAGSCSAVLPLEQNLQAYRVKAGQYGWQFFCAKATLSDLRDLVYPALNDKRVNDRPPGDDQTAHEEDGKWKEIL